MTAEYPLLDTVHMPEQLRNLSRKQLPELAKELREFLVESVSQTGGHLSSNLGVIELTIALHYVFNTPEDRLVWDVGHIHTKSSQVAVMRCANYASRGALQASLAATKVYLIPLGQGTRALQFLPR
jgi:hypothetical protein